MFTKELLLALDYGGTKLSAATLLRGDHAWQSIARRFSPPGADAAYDQETMLQLARQLLRGAQPMAVGVSFGGPVHFSTGTVRLSHHVPGWEDIPLASRLAGQFNAPVLVDNDANVAALGEHRFGAGQGCAHLCYVTVSTGVGGGWILNGLPWRGADGMAGEIGHTVVDPQGPLCLCGKRGCVERLVSGPYMAADARRELEMNPRTGRVLRELVDWNLEKITAATLDQAAEGGDELAQEILHRGAWALGVGIGNAANLVNPELFILGGGVTRQGAAFWDTVRQTARRTALPEIRFEIVPASLGDDAPLWGAVVLADQALEQTQPPSA